MGIAPLANADPIPIRIPNSSPVPNRINNPGDNINVNPSEDVINSNANPNSDIDPLPDDGTYNSNRYKSNRYKSNSYSNNGRVNQNSNVNKQKTPPLSKFYLNSILEQASNSAETLEWKPAQQWGGSYASFQPSQPPAAGGIGQLGQLSNGVSASGLFGDAIEEVGGWFGGGDKKESEKKESDDTSDDDSDSDSDKGKDSGKKDPKKKSGSGSDEGNSGEGDDDVQMICLEKGKSDKTGGLGMDDWVNFCAVLLDMATSSIPGAKPETFWKLFTQSRKMLGKVFDKGNDDDNDKEKRGFGDIIKDGIGMIV